MSSPDDPIPYRHDLNAAYDRIAALESELAHSRGAVSTAQSRALAGLRIRHLREDLAELIGRFHRRRTALFAVTALGMLGAFGAFFLRADANPELARSIWMWCGAVVTAVAATGWGAQLSLHGSAKTGARKLERRIAEEHVAAGVEPGAESSPRVRVAADALEADGAVADPLLAPDARTRSTVR